MLLLKTNSAVFVSFFSARRNILLLLCRRGSFCAFHGAFSQKLANIALICCLIPAELTTLPPFECFFFLEFFGETSIVCVVDERR